MKRRQITIGTALCLLIGLILTVHFSIVLVLGILNTAAIRPAVAKAFPSIADDYIANWTEYDPRLINHIFRHYLDPPFSRFDSYNLDNPELEDYAQDLDLSKKIRNVLGKTRNGFFVEAGAFDGETLSNTLTYERDLDWTGLLVEPNPVAILNIQKKKRKSWLLRGCLHPGNRPQRFTLYPIGWCGGLSWAADWSFAKWMTLSLFYPGETVEMWCFPLTSVLKAINQTKVSAQIQIQTSVAVCFSLI